MNVYDINGILYLHIQDFAKVTHRSPQSVRHLIEDGNSVRRLKAFRDRSRLMVPLTELAGYPFVNHGKQLNGKDIYHYKADVAIREAVEQGVEMSREFCPECTFGQKCLERELADSIIIPQGDL